MRSMPGTDAPRGRSRRAAWFLVAAIAAACAAGRPGRGADFSPGIGFLWTAQSERVAGALGSERDFVDVILGPGKLDVFERVRAPLRVVCISLALERNEERPFPGVRETIEILRRARVPPSRVVIGYNPERHPGTPSRELDDIVASVRAAKEMAAAYGAPLLVGPGLREMGSREDLYPDLARRCDIWLIQSQRLQIDEGTREPVDTALYRSRVERIAGRLREGNPKIQIYVQLVTTARRGTVRLGAERVAAFARAIEDLVDAVRIYGAPADLLEGVIGQLRAPRERASPLPSASSAP